MVFDEHRVTSSQAGIESGVTIYGIGAPRQRFYSYDSDDDNLCPYENGTGHVWQGFAMTSALLASTTWWLTSSPAVTRVLACQASNGRGRVSMGGDSAKRRSALAASAASPDSVWAASASLRVWRLSPMSGSRR